MSGGSREFDFHGFLFLLRLIVADFKCKINDTFHRFWRPLRLLISFFFLKKDTKTLLPYLNFDAERHSLSKFLKLAPKPF